MIEPELTPADAATESRQFPYWQRNAQVLPVASLLCGLGFGMAFPFLPLMVRSLGVHAHLETWMGTMMLVFYLIGFGINPIWGSIADHYGRKVMVLRASLGMGFFMSLLPFAPTPLWFAGLFMLVGLFNGFTGASMSFLVANTPPRRMSRALTWAQAGGQAGQTMGPAAGSLLAVMLGHHHWLFWVSGGLLLSGGLLVAGFAHEVRQRVEGPWRPQWLDNLRELLRVPRVGALFLLHFLYSVLWAGNITIVTVYMLQLLAAQGADAGAEAFWVGAAAMGLAVPGVIAMPWWGRIIERHGPERVLVLTTAVAALMHLPLVFLQTPLQLVLARVGFGLGAAAMQPVLYQLLRVHAPKGMDGRAIGYASSFQFLAMGAAPFCAGLVGPAFGLRAYFALTVVLTLAGLALWLRDGRDRAAPPP